MQPYGPAEPGATPGRGAPGYPGPGPTPGYGPAPGNGPAPGSAYGHPGPWGAPGYGAPGYGPPAPYPAPYPVPVRTEKSAGIAVLLTFLWLGAGHLYLNRITPGVLLLVLDFFLVLFFLLIPVIGWILGFVGWLAAFIAAAVSCSSIAAAENGARPHGW